MTDEIVDTLMNILAIDLHVSRRLWRRLGSITMQQLVSIVNDTLVKHK